MNVKVEGGKERKEIRKKGRDRAGEEGRTW